MAASIPPGTRLGRYEVVAMLGAGGMGEVYQARDAELGRIVAIKVLPASFAGHADRLRRFELEARAAAALNHPNILAVYDVGQHDGTPYIVSELLEGRTLRACLDAGPLPLRKALEFSIQIADGLAAAHDKGIVHRDLKPENIFVTSGERLKILDFGLAKLVDTDAATITAVPHTSEGVVLGTVGYLSPEQASGLPADQRSDIFSAGAVLFEMVTQRRAFSRATSAQTLAAVIEDDPFAGLSSPASGPAARVMNIVRCCLEKAPERRFQSARDLAILLAIDAPAETVAAPSASSSTIKSWTIVAVAAAALLIGLVLGGAALWLMRPPQTAGDSTTAARLTISLPADLATTYGSPVAISPDGSRIVVAMTSTGGHQLFMRSIDRDDLIPIADTQGAEFPFFSPDGKWIGFWSDRKIRRVSLDGGTPIAVADSPIAPFRGADWGDEGILFSTQALGPLFLVNVDSGDVRAATTLDVNRNETSHRWPQILPGGRAWIFTALKGATPGNTSSVMLQDRATGQVRELIAGARYARYVGDGTLFFVRDGRAFIARFDPEGLRVTGTAEPSDEPIVTRANSGAVFLSVAANGSAVFIKGGRESDRTLVWVDRQGAARPLGAPPASYQMPRLSPDGQRVAVSIAGEFGSADLYIFDPRTQVRTRVTTDGRTSGLAAWSPDGGRLAVAAQHDRPPMNVFIHAADGSGTPERVTTNTNGQFVGSWVRDGRTIVYFQADPRTGFDKFTIWGADLTPGTSARVSMLGPGLGARVSPDQRWLAYVTSVSGVVEAFVTTFPQQSQRWQVSQGGGQEVVWRPDSRELYYRRGDRLYAVPFDPAANPPVGRATVSIEGRYFYQANYPGWPNYDVAPDGRFLMINSEEGPADQVQIALNWTKDLAARLAKR